MTYTHDIPKIISQIDKILEYGNDIIIPLLSNETLIHNCGYQGDNAKLLSKLLSNLTVSKHILKEQYLNNIKNPETE